MPLGRHTAPVRIRLLLDEGSFQELEPHRLSPDCGVPARPGDGVVTGFGTVHGRRVFVFAQDFDTLGGTLGQAHADKIRRLVDLAVDVGAPVIGLYDGGGARIQEGAMALDGCGAVFARFVAASGIVPQISVVLGPCAGAAAYAPALTDFVFMVRGQGMLYLTGPDVVRAVTGEEIAGQDLGGAAVHGTGTGLAGFVHDDEESCLQDVRYLVSLLPPHSGALPDLDPYPSPADGRPTMRSLVPEDPRTPYDVGSVIDALVDKDTFLEVHHDWGLSVVCGLARIQGHVVGVVANQPLVRAGVIDIPAAEKAARFVRTCDAFNIPLVTLVDVPGFMPGRDQEHGGIIRHGAKLLFAYCEATVPRIQVIMRKAYGGAYIVMDSTAVGADLSYAWPWNEVAVMGPSGAVSILHRRTLAGADDPVGRRAELEQEYRDRHLHALAAAQRGLVHDVIDPERTRDVVVQGLDLLRHKQTYRPAKHANHPL